MTGLAWRKASASAGNGACVEVAAVPDGVLVRDSKDPEGLRLTVGAAAWRLLLEDIRKGGL